MQRLRAVAAAVWFTVLGTVRTPQRLLITGWIVGLFLVGSSGMSYADNDGFINGPDYGAPVTVFERVPLTQYTVPFGLSDSETEFPYITEAMWNIFRGLTNVILFICGALVRGAITAMQWMLDLTLYRDHAGEIDNAVRALGSAVFWPLIGATIAVALFTVWAKSSRDGAASILSEMMWVTVATVLALGFSIAPSKIVGQLDEVRTSAADAIMSGYSSGGTGSVAGFTDTAPTGGGKDSGSRGLADSMWNVYFVAPWCYSAWGDLNICKDVGHDYLDDTQRWKDLYAQQKEMNGEDPAKCPAEWESRCDWVRGQSFARLGGALFTALISVPVAVALLALVMFGAMALVGFILLLLVGILFVLGWMIPGRPRQIGVRWFEALIGSLLQNVIITALLGAVMRVSGIFTAALAQYGLFMVALLNVAALLGVFKIRAMFENMTGMASPAGTGVVSSYLAYKAVSGAARGGKRLAARTGNGVMNSPKHIGNALDKVANAPGQVRSGASAVADRYRSLKKRFPTSPAPVPQSSSGRSATATPYRSNNVNAPKELGNNVRVAEYDRGGHGTPVYDRGNSIGAGSSRVVNALPAGNTARAALPAGASHAPEVQQHRQTGQKRFVAPSSSPGEVPRGAGDGRRVIVQPSRRDMTSPPVQPRPTATVGGRLSPYRVQRQAPPLRKGPAMPVVKASSLPPSTAQRFSYTIRPQPKPKDRSQV